LNKNTAVKEVGCEDVEEEARAEDWEPNIGTLEEEDEDKLKEEDDGRGLLWDYF